MPLTHYFWHTQPGITSALVRHFPNHIGPGKLVVDVGAGYAPWQHATELVDREAWPQIAASGKPVHVLDVELDRLPYADKSVDFIYCRHTIEDLHNPTLLLREMNRVAKAGYVETPSPIAELCRGAGGTAERGFVHHHWIVWVENGTLTYLPKYTRVECMDTAGDFDGKLIDALNSCPALWYTIFPWVDELKHCELRHRDQFSISEAGSFEAVLERSLSASVASSVETVQRLGLDGVPFEFTRPGATKLCGSR
jgi:SAM-dependent methyltransferase